MSGRRVLVTGVSRPLMAEMARSLAARDDVDLVVGVDRHDQSDELRAHGADRVVTDLAEVTIAEES